jgi:multidrug efflux system outer membrane protein
MMNTAMKRHPVLVLLLVTLVLSSSCVVGPNYQRPVVNAPPTFRDAQGAAQQASFADLPWWEVFQDGTLKELIQASLANNFDLRVAVTRIEQARQIAAQARSQYFPAIDYSAGIGYGKNEFAGGAALNGGNIRGSFIALASAAWELDLWGRIRRLNEAAKANYLATEEAKRGVMLSLVSDVAQAYFELLALRLQLDIARRTTASFDDTLKLFTQRLEGGVASKLDTSRAAAARANAAASIPELERQIALKENQICVLLGRNPGSIQTSAKLLEEVIPPDIPVGLPSTLLERRPDVRVAEERVRFANAQVGLAQAAFFPRIGLTALFGQGSSPLDQLSSGDANIWSFAGNAAGPIYRGGALKANKRQAIAAWEEAKLQYEQTALSAFQDVSNALVSREKFEAIRIEQARAVEAYNEAVAVALKRYIAGFASYYEVLEAQQQLFPAENALAQTELNRRVVFIQLYKALGGGWNLDDAAWLAGTPSANPPPSEPNK